MAEILALPCTDQAIEDGLDFGMPQDEHRWIYTTLMAGDPVVIPALVKAVKRYPGSPTLKNHLMLAYKMAGRDRMADAVLKDLAKNHPDYLFTRIELALRALRQDNLDGAVKHLGPDLDIRKVMPERDVFHVTELRHFYTLVALVRARRGELDTALGIQMALHEIYPDANSDELILRTIMAGRMEAMRISNEEEEKRRISPALPPFEKKPVGGDMPLFENHQIRELYHHGMDVPPQLMQDILSLPRESLVSDLIRLLEDCVRRTPDFMACKGPAGNGAPVLHALHLLAELRACESLEQVLSLLSLHPQALDFWIGGNIHLVSLLTRMIEGNIPRCTAWLKSPGIDHKGKGLIAEAMETLGRNNPSCREEVVAAMEEILKFMLVTPREDNVLDTDFITEIICCIVGLGAISLLPIVREAYGRDLVRLSVAGTLETVEQDIGEPVRRAPLASSLAEIYADHASPPKGATNVREMEQQAGSGEIGRNEPCPCGSGKKFKKCCMR